MFPLEGGRWVILQESQTSLSTDFKKLTNPVCYSLQIGPSPDPAPVFLSSHLLPVKKAIEFISWAASPDNSTAQNIPSSAYQNGEDLLRSPETAVL